MNPLLLLAFLALAGSASAQTTWYVDLNGTPPGDGSMGNPYTSLQHCFDQLTTVNGDIVLVAPGTYVEDLDLGKALDVRSTGGAQVTTLRPATATSVLTVLTVDDVRFEGFTIRDGSGSVNGPHTIGGGVLCVASSVELEGCVLRENQASIGGNLHAIASIVTLVDCALENGRAWQGGGAHLGDGSTLIAHDTTFTSNGASPSSPATGLSRRGLGLHSTGGAALELYGCQIALNQPSPAGQFQGGGLYHEGAGTALLDGCTLSFNGQTSFSNSWGGGVYADGPVTLVGSTLLGNRALHEGGGVYATDATLAQLFDCDVLENQANNGGGVYRATLEDSRLIDNRNVSGESTCSGPGGGAYGSSLLRCTLEGNVSRKQGGGAYDSTLVECELVGNKVDVGSPCAGPFGGGGIWGGSATDCTFRENLTRRTGTATALLGGGAARQATLTRCLLEGNEVDGSSSSFHTGFGGGAYDSTLEDCTLIGNRVFGPVGGGAPRGGGIHGGSATGCTFVGNEAESTAGDPLAAGGGAAEATLERCVLVGNAADHGGAAWNSSLSRCSTYGNVASQAGGGLSLHPSTGQSWGAETMRETILWGNEPDELEVGAGSLTAEYCDVDGGWLGLGNIEADPDYWNGPAADLHLRPGSPCIGAGDPTLPLDPDGSAREIGALVFDDGYVGGPYVYCEAKVTSQGCVPSIGSSGDPSLSGPDDFVLEATQVRSLQNGILFWGLAPAEAPFYGGVRCVGPPIVRTPPASSGGSAVPCSGVLTFPFTHAYALGSGLSAGDRVFAQFWFRDPGHPDGTNVGLSDALDFTILP